MSIGKLAGTAVTATLVYGLFCPRKKKKYKRRYKKNYKRK